MAANIPWIYPVIKFLMNVISVTGGPKYLKHLPYTWIIIPNKQNQHEFWTDE
jgi:hypothetical protein